jgi:hypothetical protein
MSKKFISRQTSLPQQRTHNPFSPRPFAPAVQAKVQGDPTAAPSVEHFPKNSNRLSRLSQCEPEPESPQTQSELGNPGPLSSGLPTPPSAPRFPIQAKLTVGAVGDQYEQEADRVARQVVNRIQAPQVHLNSSQSNPVQRKISIQAFGGEGGEVSREWEDQLNRARGGGQPLASSVREPMEREFGADFSGVRVHTGGQAGTLARSIQAKAFTTEQDVFFGQGAYQPGSRGGQELIAHELTHVVQQKGKMVQRSLVSGQKNSRHSAKVTQSQSKGLSSPGHLKKFKNDALVVKEFVTAEHKQAIATYCKKNNVILSVRDTGNLSLQRINEGAKAKPHTILEKSIKESSLATAHPEAAKALKNGEKLDGTLMIEGVSLNDLKGFVGHWDKRTSKLLGVRVDKRDTKPKTSAKVARGSGTGNKESEHTHDLLLLQSYLEGKDTDSPYIPLKKFEEFKKAFGGKWTHYLYTGDYDLHEVYKHNKTLLEGSREKARLLTGINTQIARNQGKNGLPLRKGKIEAHEKTVKIGQGSSAREVPASLLHTEAGSDYAMIQHGDQMGYITNQLHEGRLKEETRDNKAQLVEVVAQESPGPLAWCVRGEWYVTKNKDEHQEFRRAVSVTASSGWLKKSQDAIKARKSRTLEIKTNQPTRLGQV